ncbi:MAG: biopolymer transporter ExbD [Steroidobacteraceae bacterium]
MSMSVGSDSGDDSMVDINTTPLIDVMLVLLIMFIITLPIMTHAVKLDMPRGDNPPPPVRPEVIDIEIDFDGTIVWNGTPISGIAALDGYFSQESDKDPQPELHIRPDKRARYDAVAKVLASAQRNRMLKIGFVNTAEFGF